MRLRLMAPLAVLGLAAFILMVSEARGGKDSPENPFAFSPEPAESKGTNLGPEVNSSHSEIGPIVSPDGRSLFFTSDRPGGLGGQDVWVSFRENGVWRKAENLGPPINTSGNEGPDCFSISDSALYFTSCDREGGHGGCDIYVSFQFDGKWSKPVNLGPPLNTRYNESNASVSPDGDFIIFTSDRPGGLGDTDLWIARRGKKINALRPGFETEGRWEEPENMGPAINTPDWDGVGFLMPDKQTLYFSSRGRKGLGLTDIFRSVYKDGKWTEAENVGDIINTPRDDIYFTLPGSGDLAYFSSDSVGGEGAEDIYSIPVPLLIPKSQLVVIRGMVKDAATGQPLKAMIKVIDQATSSELASAESNSETGQYLVVVKSNRVRLEVSREGHAAYSEAIEVEGEGAMATVNREIVLEKK